MRTTVCWDSWISSRRKYTLLMYRKDRYLTKLCSCVILLGASSCLTQNYTFRRHKKSKIMLVSMKSHRRYQGKDWGIHCSSKVWIRNFQQRKRQLSIYKKDLRRWWENGWEDEVYLSPLNFMCAPQTNCALRFNDGAVDSRGRFWAGTMNEWGHI